MLGMLHCTAIEGARPNTSSDLTYMKCCSALDLPHHMTTQVETERPAVTVVSKLVFDLCAGDGLSASNAYVARSIAGVDSGGHHHRQPTVRDELADTHP